jgi:hypothetical protein
MRERGLVFLSTPFDDASADLLDTLDVPAFKVGPADEHPSSAGCPPWAALLISTGMGDPWRSRPPSDAVRENGDVPRAVPLRPSYPARRRARTCAPSRRCGGPSGARSAGRTTPGIELPLAAVAVSASLVEKHLTLDRTLPGPDHRASLEPDAFAAMVAGIRTVEASLGAQHQAPSRRRADVAAVARRSCTGPRRSRPGIGSRPATSPCCARTVSRRRASVAAGPLRRSRSRRASAWGVRRRGGRMTGIGAGA